MAQRSIHHVVVTHEGRVSGVISEKDLFLPATGGGVAHRRCPLCGGRFWPPWQVAAEDIRRLARNLMAQGVGAEQLTRLISQLNDQLTQRILYLAFAEGGLEDAAWCWLALGSEGRYEQTLYTDQDNGLIFQPARGRGRRAAARDPAGRRAARQRVAGCLRLSPVQGRIMAGNPKWCLSLEEWQHTFGDWIFRGDAPVLLNASIFFDFRALAGDARLAEGLRAWLNGKIKRTACSCA